MFRLFFIALGGALGTLVRYLISGLDYKFSGGIFPVSTFVVNLSGSLIIGFLWGISDRIVVSPNVRLFVFMGILGGYTTFSTFTLESFNLLRDGEYGIAAANILLSAIFGIGFVFIGFFASKFLINMFD
ncbi:MAG: fluoride efflux transporter CrcB [Elusimicrobia bacterium]|nr:fluoride efflux transporter CrcB [Elusimicrobiota bacterium]